MSIRESRFVNRESEMILRELDRRIESPDSEHSEESKQLLREFRVALSIFAAGDPDGFDEACSKVCAHFGIKLEDSKV